MPADERTESGNGAITHLTEVERRTDADGTERRLQLGYSTEGFHAAVSSNAGGPYQWGTPHPEAGPALNAAWKSGTDSEKEKGEKMAEIPESVKARADAEVAQTGAQKMEVVDMGEPKGVDAYDTKALEAQRQKQREDAIQDKTDPDKGPNKA